MKQNHHLQKTTTGFHLLWLEEYIMKEHQKCKQEAILSAGELALKNRPGKNDTDIGPYVAWIKSKYQQLSSFAETTIQAGNEGEMGKNEFNLSEDKKKTLEAKIAELKILLRHKQSIIDGQPMNFPWREKTKSDIVIGAIATVEALLSVKAFQLFGDAFIFTLLIAVALGLALWGAAHAVPYLIRLGKTLAQRILISTVIAFFVTSAFYGLGILRSIYFHQTGDLDIHPAIFALSNVFFFGVATTYAYFFLPTRQDEVEKVRSDALQQKVRDMEKEMGDLVKSRDALPEKLSTSLSERLNKMSYESGIKDWIDHLCDETIGEFIRENISVRSDNIMPACFQNLAKEKINSYSLNP